MKKIIISVTLLIGLASCNNDQDEIQKIIENTPPIEVVPNPCNCTTTYWLETIYLKAYIDNEEKYRYQWEVQGVLNKSCDKTTNGEKVKSEPREFPTSIYWPTYNRYYSVTCENDN